MTDLGRLGLLVQPARSAPSIARLFVAEAARVAELDDEVVAELRLAVSEVASDSVERGRAVEVGIEVGDGLFVVTLPALVDDADDLVDRRRILAGLRTVRCELGAASTTLRVPRSADVPT